MQLIKPRTFWRVLDNGVKDPGICIHVSVDAYTGKVYDYRLMRQKGPIYISTNPRITGKEAEAIALDVLMGLPTMEEEGYYGVASAFVEKNYGLTIADESSSLSIDYDSIGLQHLVWSMLIITSEEPDYSYADYMNEKQTDSQVTGRSRLVTVDALTGEVIFVDIPDLQDVIPGLQKRHKGWALNSERTLRNMWRFIRGYSCIKEKNT